MDHALVQFDVIRPEVTNDSQGSRNASGAGQRDAETALPVFLANRNPFVRRLHHHRDGDLEGDICRCEAGCPGGFSNRMTSRVFAAGSDEIQAIGRQRGGGANRYVYHAHLAVVRQNPICGSVHDRLKQDFRAKRHSLQVLGTAEIFSRGNSHGTLKCW